MTYVSTGKKNTIFFRVFHHRGGLYRAKFVHGKLRVLAERRTTYGNWEVLHGKRLTELLPIVPLSTMTGVA